MLYWCITTVCIYLGILEIVQNPRNCFWTENFFSRPLKTLHTTHRLYLPITQDSQCKMRHLICEHGERSSVIICRGLMWACRQILWRRSRLSSVFVVCHVSGWVCPGNCYDRVGSLSTSSCILLLFQYTETDKCRLLSLFIGDLVILKMCQITIKICIP